MGRRPKHDYRPMMVAAARRALERGDEVSITAIAAELEVSPSLVHFYVGDRQRLVDEAWREILLAFVDDDLGEVASFAEARDWDGMAGLVQRVFSAERDAVHVTHVRAAVEALSSEALAAVIADATRTTIESWQSLLELSTAAGVVSTHLDSEAVARIVIALPLGMAVIGTDLDDRQRVALAEAWTTMLRAVLDPTFDPHVQVPQGSAGELAPAPPGEVRGAAPGVP